MRYKRWSVTAAAFLFGSAITSCAYQSDLGEPSMSQQRVIQPTVSGEPLKQDRKTLAGRDKESDCVLTAGDINLWCKWIAHYY